MKKWMGIFAILLLSVFNTSSAEAQTPAPIVERVISALSMKDVTNILVLGVDNNEADRMEARGNSDGIMLVSINPNTEEIVLTSFMRDTRVRIDDTHRDKLTNIYRDYGLETFISVFEKNFEIPVDYHVIFNYLDVIDAVDSVGGVEIDLAREEVYSLQSKIRDICELKKADYKENELTWDDVGRVTLNGIQAAGYMRIRPAYGHYDAGRTERTRTVVKGVIGKAYEMSKRKMISLALTFMRRTENDFSAKFLISVAINAKQLKTFKMISDRIPLDEAYTSENSYGYYADPDFEINNAHLKDSIYNGMH